MKQLSLTAALILLCMGFTRTVSAQKCKFVTEQADPFTKQIIYNSQQPIGPLMGGWTFILRQVGNKYYIGFGIQNGKGTTDKLAKGSKIALKFANESTVDIVTTKEYESTPLQLGDHQYMQWVVCEEVSEETFAKFGESPIKALKMSFIFKGNSQEFILPGIKDRQGERIMATATCMIAGK